MESEAGLTSRARAIYERALSVDYTITSLWLNYAKMEAKAHNNGELSSILERATSLLPFKSSLWRVYITSEENQGNYDRCRQIYEKWSSLGAAEVWNPWYFFEVRHGNATADDLKTIVDHWIDADPADPEAWLAAISVLGAATARARFGTLSIDKSNILRRVPALAVTESDKFLGTETDVVERAAEENGKDIELWWVSLSTHPKYTEALLAKAISVCKPVVQEFKTTDWRRYALLWLRYAYFMERNPPQDAGAKAAAIDIYEAALKEYNHEKFTSATLWKNYAHYFLRTGQLDKARKVFSSGLRKTKRNPTGNVHLICDYIEFEKKLLETDRVRRLYEILCTSWPTIASSWIDFCNFELALNERERVKYIYRTVLDSAVQLDDEDSLWISWAESTADYDINGAREIWQEAVVSGADRPALYSQFAIFETGLGMSEESDNVDEEALVNARAVFNQGLESLSASELDYNILFDLFIQFEETYGSEESLAALLSRDVREAASDTDSNKEMDTETVVEPAETITESVEPLPDEQPSMSSVQRLLANARKWKESQQDNTAN